MCLLRSVFEPENPGHLPFLKERVMSTATTAKGKKISTFLTHRFPQLDEILAYWMLLRFWAEKCAKKGVKIMFWSEEGPEASARLTEILKDDGVLACGIGGGELDEHPAGGNNGKKGECAATLAAKKFGVSEVPELKRFLNFVRNNDLAAKGTPFDVAGGLRAMYKTNPENPMKAIEWALSAIDAFYAEEVEFTKALEEFRAKAVIDNIVMNGSGTQKVATIECDNESAIRAFRFLGMKVLIQKHSSGNVQIFTAKDEIPILDDVARILRLSEQERLGKVLTTDWTELAKGGTVPGAEAWYYFREGNMLLNGSRTRDNKPTTIPLDKIREAVKIGLSSELFHSSRFRDCKAGKCTSSRRTPCPWYDFGLARCRKIRYEMNAPAPATHAPAQDQKTA